MELWVADVADRGEQHGELPPVPLTASSASRGDLIEGIG